MSEAKHTPITAKAIARLAYGYELMFAQLCHLAGTSGGSTSWFTAKAQEVTERVDPLWKLNEESNAGKPGDFASQFAPFAQWAHEAEKKAAALDQWRQEVGKLHAQCDARDALIKELLEALKVALQVMENVDGENCCRRGIEAAEAAIAKAEGRSVATGDGRE